MKANKKSKKTKKMPKKSSVNSVYHTIKDYVSSTNIHGFNYISNEEYSIASRLFWIVVVILALSFTTFQMSSLRTQWMNNPVVTTLDTIALPIQEIEFPAVTICPQGSVRNVLDHVLFKQFKKYIENKARNETIRGTLFSSKESTTTSQRKEEAAWNMTYEVMIHEAYEFLKDVYPGAKENPVKIIKMLNSDDPESVLRNEALLFPIEEKECNTSSNLDILNSLNYQLGHDLCPVGFTNVEGLGCLKRIRSQMTYKEASDYCKTIQGGNILRLDSYEEIKKLQEHNMIGKHRNI